MTHTLTIYGNKVRVIVQTKDLNFKQAAEAAAHFKRTVYQAIIDAPHVGTQREHLKDEFSDDAPEPEAPDEPTPADPADLAPVDRAGRPLKAAKKAKKGAKKGR